MHIATIKITDRYTGPLLLKEGLRPFFLLANLWAVLCVMLWVSILTGLVSGPELMAALDWHRHELLFGFTGAVMAGFLLTVAANWTGRAPIAGDGLLALVMLWLAGRVVMWRSLGLTMEMVALVDLAFPVVLLFVISRELILGKNYRNLRVILVFAMFTLANAVFHQELISGARPVVGTRLGLGAALVLIMLVGGRIIPAFTSNWLRKRNATKLPAPFGMYDVVTLIVSIVTLIYWSIGGESLYLGIAMLLAGILNSGRLARWRGEQVFKDPLVLILHLAFAFVPLGFFAFSASLLWTPYITISAATHLWATGAVAVTCMAVMTRAGLGHTGQALSADLSIVTIYSFLLCSVLLRFVASVSVSYMTMIQLSAALWCLAHLIFVFRYAKIFVTSK